MNIRRLFPALLKRISQIQKEHRQVHWEREVQRNKALKLVWDAKKIYIVKLWTKLLGPFLLVNYFTSQRLLSSEPLFLSLSWLSYRLSLPDFWEVSTSKRKHSFLIHTHPSCTEGVTPNLIQISSLTFPFHLTPFLCFTTMLSFSLILVLSYTAISLACL